MKNLVLSVCIALIATLTTSQKSFGSYLNNRKDSTIFTEKSAVISLRRDSKPINYSFEVKKRSNRLDIKIESVIKKGQVLIEIYKPNGEKLRKSISIDTEFKSVINVNSQPYLVKKNGEKINLGDSIKSINLERIKEIKGDISESISDAPLGKWIVKITPVKASGKVSLTTTSHYDR
ncbi:hypothetical protein EYV94_21355 [Puteibacter caeruleilacunae]|nr:hypothetical protein EYV94_21355 [Puteibacter caeruleilacunae]